MFDDPPAPQPLQQGEAPPQGTGDPLGLDGQPRAWQFNPEYQKLVTLWQQVMPMMESLTGVLKEAERLAQSRDVWDAPVGQRYVEDIGEWQKRLGMYRQSMLGAISDQAADTPRWVPVDAGAPHAFS
ncbi:hypothetical protein [Spongiactinospora sp. TRM90649]|uniref:hypothetical protein n=1 Tax=Spongiactinospora sp. TRM90649 TaxID=3031114 RepID=UPI0023F8D7C0|nr:hypothetical protein [Spongiactinospora sp. TRM90649]MDF5752541.1 hypothetical protein [Spongiactinospora sp. TRM90649]